MEAYRAALSMVSFMLEATLLFRSHRDKFLSQFPLFYSYVAYVLCGSAAAYVVYLLTPVYYPAVYWFHFLITLIAEFAVLVEVSDHMFNPYPAIRRLGRLLAIGVSITFFFFYILPPLLAPRPPDVAIIDLVKRSSLTKAVVIIFLLSAARYYRTPLGTNVSGILLGFSAYLATNVANFALLERYGRALYGRTFSNIIPLSYTLALLVWTRALWRYEPGFPNGQTFRQHGEKTDEPMSYRLGRFNTALTRLLRR